MLIRLFDYLKLKGITGLFTYLAGPRGLEETEVGVSSLIDTWIELRDLEHAGERNRAVYILKSRGMPHSNQVREFIISDKGVDLVDAYVGPSGVMIGSARLLQQAQAQADHAERKEAFGAPSQRAISRRRQLIAAQIEALQGELAAAEEDTASAASDHETRERQRRRAVARECDSRSSAHRRREQERAHERGGAQEQVPGSCERRGPQAWQARRGVVGASPLRRRADAAQRGSLRQPEEDLRGAPSRPLPHRGGRPPRQPDARPRRPDPRGADARAPAAAADEEDHRRLLQRRAGCSSAST